MGSSYSLVALVWDLRADVHANGKEEEEERCMGKQDCIGNRLLKK
jgi:hypothetical protein